MAAQTAYWHPQPDPFIEHLLFLETHHCMPVPSRCFIHQGVTSHQGTSRLSSILSPQHVNQMDSSRQKLLALSDKFIPKTGNRVFPLTSKHRAVSTLTVIKSILGLNMYTPNQQQHIPFSFTLVYLSSCTAGREFLTEASLHKGKTETKLLEKVVLVQGVPELSSANQKGN